MDIREFKINGFTFIAFWIFLLLILIFLFHQWNKNNFGGIQYASINDIERKVSIRMSRSHQYNADGTINDIKVSFVIDTGANSVALSRKLADSAGLKFLSETIIQTASGQVNGSLTRIKNLKIGPIELFNVKAVILPADMDYVLLGMSALKKLKLNQIDNLLTLTQQVGEQQ